MKRLDDEFKVISDHLCELHTQNANFIKEKISDKDERKAAIWTEVDKNLKKQLIQIKEGTATLAEQIYERGLHFDTNNLDKLINEVISATKTSIAGQVDTPYRKLLKFSDTTMELFFKAGYYPYNDQDYETAIKIFHFLPILDNTLYPYWFGLGATEQAIEHYPEALKAYRMAIKTDPNNSPVPYLSCAYCANETNNKEDTVRYLDKALELSESSNDYNEYKEVALEAKSAIR